MHIHPTSKNSKLIKRSSAINQLSETRTGLVIRIYEADSNESGNIVGYNKWKVQESETQGCEWSKRIKNVIWLFQWATAGCKDHCSTGVHHSGQAISLQTFHLGWVQEDCILAAPEGKSSQVLRVELETWVTTQLHPLSYFLMECDRNNKVVEIKFVAWFGLHITSRTVDHPSRTVVYLQMCH